MTTTQQDDYRELWRIGRFDEALAAATSSEHADATAFSAKAGTRLRFLREHGVPVAVHIGRSFHELALFVGGAGLRFVDGCPYNDRMRPYLCDPRTQDVEPFLAALARAAAIELPAPTAGRRWPICCGITV